MQNNLSLDPGNGRSSNTGEAPSIFKELCLAEELMRPSDFHFYISLKTQFENSGNLSPRQLVHLRRLGDRYSQEAILEEKNWRDNYSDEHRTAAIRCAHYYDAGEIRYYGTIVNQVLLSPHGHILSSSDYNKLCNNKYAKRILAEYETLPKFSISDLARVRKTNRLDIANCSNDSAPRGALSQRHLGDKLCVVLEANALPITRACKGARVYKILLTGETQPIYAHESDLKKNRRLKK